MRGELLISAARPDNDATADQDAWLVVGCCLIGLVATAYSLVKAGSADNLGSLVAQANLW